MRAYPLSNNRKNGTLANLSISAHAIGAAASHGRNRTPASMSRSIQTYVPFFVPEGDSIPEKSAGSHTGSVNGVRVRSHVALIPPNPKTVEEPWWSETTRPLTWSLAQYAGSSAAGIVPSRHPARVDGGGMPANTFARSTAPHTANATFRRPPRSPTRSRMRKNPTPAKMANGIIRYSAWRYGMITRGANAIPTTADNRRATSHAFGWIPSRSRSRNFRPEAEKDINRASGTKESNPSAGTRNEVPGTPPRIVTVPTMSSVPAATTYHMRGDRSPGRVGRYRHRIRRLAATRSASTRSPMEKRTKRSHHGWTLTSGRIDSRNAVA